eukprot:11033889-Ditylum_brightwellii.AAC.1
MSLKERTGSTEDDHEIQFYCGKGDISICLWAIYRLPFLQLAGCAGRSEIEHLQTISSPHWKLAHCPNYFTLEYNPIKVDLYRDHTTFCSNLT